MNRVVLLVTLGLSSLATATAQAGLGGGLPAVLADAAVLQGTVQASLQERYTVQEIAAPSGLQVKEFLDGAGAVFAVSWSGPVVPDLKLLLAGFYGEYSAALAKQAPAELRRSGSAVLPDLVVQSSGHLRAYVGRAYLPSRMPAGLLPAQIR